MSALDTMCSRTICARLSLIQFIIFRRINFSKVLLLPNIDSCDRQHVSQCNLTHILFIYFTIMSKVLKVSLDVM